MAYDVEARLKVTGASQWASSFEQAASSADKLSRVSGKMKGVASTMGRVGSTLTNKITKPALIATAALVGVTLVSGFNRLVGIDTAKAKLEALGFTSKEVTNIMEDALHSVKGTSFALEDAATGAASAVAAGIKPGKDLKKYLTTVGDAAAVTGVEFNDMSRIFGKVETSNKAYNGSLQELSDRGLPIYKWLAEEAGVAEDAVFDMASNGEISAKMFRDAIEKNIGGAAQIMGQKSFLAGFDNVKAAIARVGAAFLDGGEKGEGMFSKLKPLMADMIDWLDGMGDTAEEWGVKFGDAITKIVDKAKELYAGFKELPEGVQDAIKKFALFGTVAIVALGPILKFLSPILYSISILVEWLVAAVTAMGGLSGASGALSGAFTVLSGPVGIIIAAISVFVGLIVMAWEHSEKLRDTVTEAWETIKEKITEAVGAVKDFILEEWGALVEWWEEHNEIIKESAGDAWEIIGDNIATVIDGIMVVFLALGTIVELVWEGIKLVIGIALDVILGLVEIWAFAMQGDWDEVWNSLKDIVSNVMERIREFLIGILDIIFNLFGTSFEEVNEVVHEKLDAMKEMIDEKFGTMLEVIGAVLNTIWDVVKIVWGYIKATFANALEFILGLVTLDFGRMKDAVKSQSEATDDLLDGIWRAIKKNLGGIWNDIKQAASDKWEEVKQKIIDKAEKAKTAVSDKFGEMVDAAYDKLPGVVKAAIEFFGGFKDEASDKSKEAKDEVEEQASQMPGKVSAFREKMKTAGATLGEGLKAGLKSMAEDVAETAGWLAGKAYKAAKKAAKSKSPSRVWMSLGHDFGEGLAIGMDDMGRKVGRSGEDLAKKAMFEPEPFNMTGRVNDINKQAKRDLTQSLNSNISVGKQAAVINVNVGSKRIASEVVDDITKLQNLSAHSRYKSQRRGV